MATRGFEFAYMLDGTNATPKTIDFTCGETTAYKEGDLVLMQSDGYVDKVTTATTEVTAVMAEAQASPTAGTTKAQGWVITRNQVWKCSMDASSTAFVVASTKTIDTVDANTISATDSTGGGMILVDASETDDESNVLAYVVFADTSFGNT